MFAAQIIVVGLEVYGRRARHALRLGCCRDHAERFDDISAHFVLDSENFRRATVEPVGPQVVACRGVDQLCGDTGLFPRSLHAAFDHVTDAELAGDVGQCNGLALVGEHRVAGDHVEPGKFGQVGNQGLGNAVGEIVLARITAQVREWQHRDGGPLWREGLLPFKHEGEKGDQQCPGSRQDQHSRTRPI